MDPFSLILDAAEGAIGGVKDGLDKGKDKGKGKGKGKGKARAPAPPVAAAPAGPNLALIGGSALVGLGILALAFKR